jgi:hypothetical protein
MTPTLVKLTMGEGVRGCFGFGMESESENEKSQKLFQNHFIFHRYTPTQHPPLTPHPSPLMKVF